MYYVYVLRSIKDKKLYKGSTKNICKRLSDHNAGRVNATKHRRPLKLIYSETFANKEEALKREKYLKTFKGGKELSKIISVL